jgi:membrane protease YdiL (CAAX protease family)
MAWVELSSPPRPGIGSNIIEVGAGMAVQEKIQSILAAVKAFVLREIGHCRSELERIRTETSRSTSLRAAVVWSVVAVVWGNLVVLAGRRYGHDQWITLIGVPAFGGVGCLWLWRRGFRWDTLGLRAPRTDHAPLLTGLTVMAAVIAGACALAGLLTFGHEMRGMRTIRTIVGTAFGEELIHRGVLLAVWATTGASAWIVVVMNMVVFGAWHLAGATCDGFHGWQVFWPTVGAVLFVWLRLRFGSIFAPTAVHALNVTGVLKSPKPPCPYPLG